MVHLTFSNNRHLRFAQMCNGFLRKAQVSGYKIGRSKGEPLLQAEVLDEIYSDYYSSVSKVRDIVLT